MRELLRPSCVFPRNDFNDRQFTRFQGLPEKTWGKDESGTEVLSRKSSSTSGPSFKIVLAQRWPSAQMLSNLQPEGRMNVLEVQNTCPAGIFLDAWNHTKIPRLH